MIDAIELRPYQQDMIAAITGAYRNGKRRVLGQLPTGMGKTVVFGTLAAGTSRRSLILAHRDELIEQAVAKLHTIRPDLDIGVVKAERQEVDRQVVVASVQTLARTSTSGEARPRQTSSWRCAGGQGDITRNSAYFGGEG